MKVEIVLNYSIDPFDQTSKEFNMQFRDDFLIIHHNKIIKIEYSDFFTEFKTSLPDEIDFKLDRYKGGIYLITIHTENQQHVFNAKLNYLNFFYIKFLKSEYPTNNMNVNSLIYSIIGGIIGFILARIFS